MVKLFDMCQHLYLLQPRSLRFHIEWISSQTPDMCSVFKFLRLTRAPSTMFVPVDHRRRRDAIQPQCNLENARDQLAWLTRGVLRTMSDSEHQQHLKRFEISFLNLNIKTRITHPVSLPLKVTRSSRQWARSPSMRCSISIRSSRKQWFGSFRNSRLGVVPLHVINIAVARPRRETIRGGAIAVQLRKFPHFSTIRRILRRIT